MRAATRSSSMSATKRIVPEPEHRGQTSTHVERVGALHQGGPVAATVTGGVVGRSEPQQELSRRERQHVATVREAPLQLMAERAVGRLGQPAQRERGAQTVTREPLEALPIVFVHGDARVPREAVLARAASRQGLLDERLGGALLGARCEEQERLGLVVGRVVVEASTAHEQISWGRAGERATFRRSDGR